MLLRLLTPHFNQISCVCKSKWKVFIYFTLLVVVLHISSKVIFCVCTARFLSDLVRSLEDRFSYQAAHIYWAKVLPEQWELIQIFRKHEIFRKILRLHFEQAIIHLSKLLNFILIKCLQITSFVNVLEVPTQNLRLQT